MTPQGFYLNDLTRRSTRKLASLNSRRPAAAEKALRLLVLDRIAEDADALDLDLADIAVPHPGWRLPGMGDARWRASEQEIARFQGDALGGIDDRLGDREHHVRGIVGLLHLAVDPA